MQCRPAFPRACQPCKCKESQGGAQQEASALKVPADPRARSVEPSRLSLALRSGFPSPAGSHLFPWHLAQQLWMLSALKGHPAAHGPTASSSRVPGLSSS